MRSTLLTIFVSCRGIVRQENYSALQRLTRTRYELTQSLVCAKQHFLHNFYYKANNLAVGKQKTSVFGATMMDLLIEDMTLDEIVNTPTEALADYLSHKGCGRFADPQGLAKDIQKAVRSSYRLGKVMNDSVDTVLAVYAKEIKTFKK